MDKKNSNEGIKEKFTDKKTNVSTDINIESAELKLDNFQIVDLSVEDEQKEDEANTSSDTDNGEEKDDNGEAAEDNDMQDVSDDGDETESLDDEDDSEKNESDGDDDNNETEGEDEQSEGNEDKSSDEDKPVGDGADNQNNESSPKDEDGSKKNEEGNSGSDTGQEKTDENKPAGDAGNKNSDENKPADDGKTGDGNKTNGDPEDKKTDDNNSGDKSGDKKANENKANENKSNENKSNENKPNENNANKPGENKSDKGKDKGDDNARRKSAPENKNADKKGSYPNSSRENANKNKPPKGNQQKKGNLRDRARQGLKNKAQQSFNNSRLGQTVNSAKEKANNVKQTVENTKKVASFLARHPWIIAVLAVILFLLLIIILISMLFTADASSDLFCSHSLQSLGSGTAEVSTLATKLLDSNSVIVLKDTKADNFSSIKAAPALHNTDNLDLNIKRYVMGVAYSEVGIFVQYEGLAKAEMIAAKSFIIGRIAQGGGIGTMGMSYEYDTIDGKTVFYLRGNEIDQDFCDIYEGCETGRYSKTNITSGASQARVNKKPPLKNELGEEAVSNLEKWYDEVINEFVLDDNSKSFYGAQLNNTNNNLEFCPIGSCLFQEPAMDAGKEGATYEEILFDMSYTDKRYTLYDVSTDNISVVTKICSSASALTSSCGITDDEFTYYSQKVEPYASKYFCGREGSEEDTIEKAGCGITAMSMIISNLTDIKIDPIKANEEAYAGYNNGKNVHCNAVNGGTKYSYFKDAAEHYNLTYSHIEKSNNTNIDKSADELVNTIRSGGLAIIEVNNSWLIGGRNFHYLVARGIDGEGNLIIADPAAKGLNDIANNRGSNHISAVELLQDYVDNGRSWFLFTSDKSEKIVEKYCSSTGSAVLDGDWLKASKYDVNKIKEIGKQCHATCYSTVMAYGAYINNDKTGYNKCQKYGDAASVYGGKSYYYGSESEMFAAIVKELNKGNTVAVHGRSSINQHWVLAVGYNKNYNENNAGSIKASDILTVDPYTASEKPLSQSLSGGFNVRAYGYSNNHLIIWN